MGGLMKWLEKMLGGGPGGTKRLSTFRWLMLLGLVGAAFMILNSFITIKDVDPVGAGRASPTETAKPALGGSLNKEQSSFREYEEAYQTQLKEILSKVVGVG